MKFDDLFGKPFEVLDAAMEKLDDVFEETFEDRLKTRIDEASKQIEEAKIQMNNSRTYETLGEEAPASSRRTTVSIGNRRKQWPEHQFEFDYHGRTVYVQYNDQDDYILQTNGDINATVMFEVRQRILEDMESRGKAEKVETHNLGGEVEPPITYKVPRKEKAHQRRIQKTTDRLVEIRDESNKETKMNIWASDIFGSRSRPIPSGLVTKAKVTVTSRSSLSALLYPNLPKYQVFLGKQEVYMRKMEDMMYRSEISDLTARTYLEGWLRDWTEDEKKFLRIALRGVKKLGFNRKYHDETLSILEEQLAVQSASPSDARSDAV